MAESQNTDTAAEKAFAEAAEKKTAEAQASKPAETPKAASAKAATAKPRTKTKRVSARKKPVAPKSTKAAARKPAVRISTKDTIMANTKTTGTRDFTNTAKDVAAKAQTRIKAAYDKGTAITAEATEFQKGNLEALAESGRIVAARMQDIGRSMVEDTRAAVETAQDDVRKMAAIKSPTELFQLQGEIARRNFDAAVAAASKNSEAFLKLAGDAFAPMSSRMSMAAEKVSKAA